MTNYFDEVQKILEISVQGNRMVQDFPTFLEIIGAEEDQDNRAEEKHQLSMAEIRARAEFAKNEAQRGHPTLHAHALIAQWAALETSVEDLCVAFLVNKPDFLKKDIFAKAKVPLAEFQLLDKEERSRFLLGEVERQGAARRYGVDRFETLLEPFELSGPVGDDIKKSLYACHHVRNVLVHRGSIADRRIVEACPWLGLRIGDRLMVTQQTHHEYSHDLWRYLLIIAQRVRNVFDIAPTSPLEDDRNYLG